MSDSNYTSSGGGVGFFGLLTIVFIVLKVLGKINWSWWVVLLPLWVGAAVSLVGILIAAIMLGVYEARRKERE